MNSKLQRRLATGTAFAATGILATSIAVAAWSSTGSGVGAAEASTSADSVISSDEFAADLYPGAVAMITIQITNPNPYPVVVTSIPGATSDASGDCPVGTVFTEAVGDGSFAVAQTNTETVIGPKVGDTDGSGVYQLTTRMKNDADESCKDAEFNLPITGATLESAASTIGNE